MAAIIIDIAAVQSPDAAASRPEATPSVPVDAGTSATQRRTRISEKSTRVQLQPGFVLHHYPYKETSLIVDLFSRDHGRVALVAKGAKRPYSRLRGMLQTFQPLSVGWSGKSEVRTLTAAEWIGGLPPLEKAA